MRITFHNREAAHEHGAEQGGAHLAHAAAHAFDRPPAIDDPRFGKSVIEAHIAEYFTHRKSRARRHKNAMETCRRDFDIFHPLGIRASEIGSLRTDQFADPQRFCGGCIETAGCSSFTTNATECSPRRSASFTVQWWRGHPWYGQWLNFRSAPVVSCCRQNRISVLRLLIHLTRDRHQQLDKRAALDPTWTSACPPLSTRFTVSKPATTAGSNTHGPGSPCAAFGRDSCNGADRIWRAVPPGQTHPG